MTAPTLFDLSAPAGQLYEVTCTDENGTDMVCTFDHVPWSGSHREAVNFAADMRVQACAFRRSVSYRVDALPVVEATS